MDSNAEAGPSTLRPHRSSSPSTPTPLTPTSARAKRRSWFGLASPVILSKDKAKDKRRGSSNGTEELELRPVLNRRDNDTVKDDRSEDAWEEELKERKGCGSDDLLTIDGDLENTVKKQKKKSGVADEPLILRMEDLGRKTPARTMSEKTLTVDDVMKTPHALTTRIFSPTTSGSDPFTAPDPPSDPELNSLPFNKSEGLLINPAPRSSSLNLVPSPITSFERDKTQPPVPIPVDRPLPPLPPPTPDNEVLKAPKAPSEIFITPSSPQKPKTTKRKNGEEETNGDQGGGGKLGVLEWFGVKKTVRRKASETRLRESRNELDDIQNVAGDSSRSPEGQTPQKGSTDQVNEGGQHSGQPGLPLPPTTDAPHGTPKRLNSLFARRSSAKNEEEAEPLSIMVVPRTAHSSDSPSRPLTNVSQSSLQLPAVDPFSPDESSTWMSSPGIENEEMLFSPGSSTHWGPGIRPWMEAREYLVSSRSSVSSALDTLPEQVPPMQKLGPAKASAKVQEGRVRSFSDGPLPQRTSDHSPASSQHASNSPNFSSSPSEGPKTPVRPRMDSRTGSSNSAIIGRMKSVFSKSASRSRSNSLLRQDASDVDEFGGVANQHSRPSASASSMRPSDTARDGAMMEDNVRLESQQEANQPVGRASRSSMTPSLSSNASSTRHSILGDSLHAHATASRRSRVRASTISLAPASYHFTPPSPSTFPTSATPPRRQSTIRRLSNGLFGSASSSPQHSALFPLPPRSSGSTSSIVTGTQTFGQGWEDGSSGMLSPGVSPRPSLGSLAVKPNAMKQAAVPEGGESPKEWLGRALSTVGSGDAFHVEALQMFMATFNFTHNALDVALRKLLMQISLPKETQQIDRVIEAFARQYERCEPGLFGEKDNTYVLAFSMMMLHTDAFNKHNKNKMSKSDYVRNSRMEGVPSFVLEAFYDNITFTPFVFIEDDSDLKGTSGYTTPLNFGPSTPTFSNFLNGSNPPSKASNKIDVYDLIVRDMLNHLRVDVGKEIPVENPFSCLGTRPILDFEGLSKTFASAHSLSIPLPQQKTARRNTLVTPGKRQAAKREKEPDMALRVTKVGLISRKDEAFSETGKKNRKWKSWSVILTQSQLLFFKDPMWALTLLEQARVTSENDKDSQLLLPRMTHFKPDEVFPVKDCIAVFDKGFTTYPNTFRFVISQHQQYLMQASDEFEMNEWISLINYASAFKSAGIKMRHGTMRKDQAVLAGAAAAASHRRDIREERHGSLDGASTPGRIAVFGDVDQAADQGKTSAHLQGDGVRGVDIDGANDSLQEGEQLEEVFGVVKAELAAGRGGAKAVGTGKQPDRSYSHASRLAIIRNHLRILREKVLPIESSIRSSLLLARNINILTPFQKSTRDRLASVIPSLARRTRTERIFLSKMQFWIDVLEYEADRAEREWKEVRHLALQAAARSLREEGVRGVVEDVARDEEGEDRGVPVLFLPNDRDEDVENEATLLSMSPGELPIMFRRPSNGPNNARSPTSRDTSSSRAASLLEESGGDRRQTVSSDYFLSPHETERRSSDVESAYSRAGTPDMNPNGYDGSRRERKDSEAGRSSGRNTPLMFVMESPMEIGYEGTQERFFKHTPVNPQNEKRTGNKDESREGRDEVKEEEAEDWKDTKAATRVSLVRPGETRDWESMRKINAENKG
ncbi:ARF guanyl-nucleotide exchange factor [Cryptococcus deuterogattii LA55]|nr:ARF guanyl-nucleotide exchange factor [Cryptococcus deuterogattii LA55]KIR95025.1 ARF guanyl-nucleotide exchange factor [Cryptococcus deuterogattii CBS 10090]